MIPVTQARVSVTDGDCLAACFASIFERTLESMPSFVDGIEGKHAQWLFAARAWLAPANLSLTCVKDVDVPDGLSILTVRSKRFPGAYHAVVARDGEPVHDPSPTPDLVWAADNVCWYHILNVLDPLRPVDLLKLGAGS